MAEPVTTAAIGGIIVSAPKEVGKGAGGYAKKTLGTLWDNKYILIIAGISSGIFIYYYNMLYNGFGFPPILNIAVLGIFALINFTGVVSNGKNSPASPSGGNSEPRIRINN